MVGILVLILTGVLMYLYHKFFTVVYVNALSGIIREIVVCLILSALILSAVFKLFGIELDSKGTEAYNPSAQVQTETTPEPTTELAIAPVSGPAPGQSIVAVPNPSVTSFSGNEEYIGEYKTQGHAQGFGVSIRITYDAYFDYMHIVIEYGRKAISGDLQLLGDSIFILEVTPGNSLYIEYYESTQRDRRKVFVIDGILHYEKLRRSQEWIQ